MNFNLKSCGSGCHFPVAIALAFCLGTIPMLADTPSAKMNTFDNPKPGDYVLYEDQDGLDGFEITNVLGYGIRGSRALHMSYVFSNAENRGYMFGMPKELGTAPHLKFSYRFAGEDADYEETGRTISADTPLMVVDISEDGCTWDTVYTLGPNQDNKYTPTLEYSDVDVDLREYANKTCSVRFSFGLAPDENVSQDSRWGVSIDNLMLGTQLEYDLGVASLMGPSSILYDENYDYTLVIENLGKSEVGKFLVTVTDNDGEEVYTISDQDLGVNAAKEYKFSWSAWKSGNYTLSADVKITDEEDGDESDNTSEPIYIAARSLNKTKQHVISSPEQDMIKSSPVLPVNFNSTCSAGGSLYYANEIGVNRGTISAVIYKVAGPEYLSENFKVYVGETLKTELDDREVFNPDEMTLVFEGRVHFPDGEYEMAIPFKSPYKYKGGNLIIYTEHYGQSFVFGRYGMVSLVLDETRRSVTRYSKFDLLDSEELRTKKPQGDGGMYANIVLNMTDAPSGTISGYVKDTSGAALQGVRVNIQGEAMTAITDADGSYVLSRLAEDNYTLVFHLDGFDDYSTEVDVYPNEDTQEDVVMGTISEITVSGKVTDSEGKPLQGAEIALWGVFSESAFTAADGTYSIEVKGKYDYDITVCSPYYMPDYSSISLGADSMEKNFELIALANAPHKASAQISADQQTVEISCSKALLQLRHDNGECVDGVGFDSAYPDMIFGSVFREKAVVKEIVWFNGEGVHGNFSVYVFGLWNGKPNVSDLLYKAENVDFIDNSWNSHVLTTPVVADGFMIAIGCDGYMNLGVARVSENYPFLEGNEYYAGDSYTDHLSDMSLFTTDYHLMLRAGVELADGITRTEPEIVGYHFYRIKENTDEWKIVGKSETPTYFDDLLNLEDGVYRWAVASDYGDMESEKTLTEKIDCNRSGVDNMFTNVEVIYDSVSKSLIVETAEVPVIKIYDAAGNCMEEVRAFSASTSELPEGIYIALIQLNDSRVVVKKFHR